jgi:hypothetical protein
MEPMVQTASCLPPTAGKRRREAKAVKELAAFGQKLASLSGLGDGSCPVVVSKGRVAMPADARTNVSGVVPVGWSEEEPPATLDEAWNDLPTYTFILNGAKKWAKWRKQGGREREREREVARAAVRKAARAAGNGDGERVRAKQAKRQGIARPSSKLSAWAGRRVDRLIDYVAPRPNPRTAWTDVDVNLSILKSLFASGRDGAGAGDDDDDTAGQQGLGEEGFSLFAPTART